MSAPDRAPLTVQVAEPVCAFGVELFADEVVVAAAHAWYSTCIGTDIRFVHLNDPSRRRSIDPALAKPADGVFVTTTDQRTAERGKEPLRTLARHRWVGKNLRFGRNVIPDSTGPIRIGALVRVLG